jgi:hypothetical protein
MCVAAVTAWLAAGCGAGSGDVVGADVPVAPEQVGSEVGEHLAEVPWAEIAPEQVPAEVVGETAFDLVPAEATAEAGPEEGGMGWPCTSGSECESGFCLWAPTGKQCTITCIEDCPAGFECLKHEPSLPDEVYICAPSKMNVCKPCQKNTDCQTNGVDSGDRCVPYGDAGSFCGAACMGSGDCGEGYECKAALDVWGQETQQCVLKAGECDCEVWFLDEGAATACKKANEWGVCAGARSCGVEGLSPCDAAVPGKELCNAADDDCDGEIDEEAGGDTCYSENNFGACKGTYECAAGKLSCDAAAPAPEVCDGLDNDCDGTADDGFPDSDKDGSADCLEADKDGDGALDLYDNCPNAPNPGQEDFDLDMAGDACDPDDDNDMVADEKDCAPKDPKVNPNAKEECDGKDNDCDALIDEGFGDADGDALANCIDPDDDNDGFSDEADCAATDPAIYPGSPEICDGKDNDCDFDVDENFPDADKDGKADCMDADLDDDKVPNGEDNCVSTPNPGQEDQDKDGQGDACDADVDGDGIPGPVDNCPLLFNPGQKDLDKDGKGDDCDEDVDGDGLLPDKDNCPLVANPQQVDSDKDGIGDACDGDEDGDGDPNATDCAPQNPYVGSKAAETCDGLDNDCDGLVDEGFGDKDQDGLKDCVDPDDDNDGDTDASDCKPLDPTVYSGAAEICNGVDDDCDGQVDEDIGVLACGKGQCFHTEPMCAGGKLQACDPFEDVAPEACDGKDNDCDGLTDEDLGVTTCGVGACYHSAASCVGGKTKVCDPLQGASAETCDGVDNDCDGKVDEDLGAITCGKGICKHTVSSCLGGQVQSCDPLQGAIDELCDGLDNDCDGQTDEGYGDLDSDGKPDCVDTDDDGDGDPDVTDCAPGDPDVSHLAQEVCDGVDNNCKGGVDEAGATGCETLYYDGDFDGHGVADKSQCLCGPSGFYKAVKGDDCDDTNPWVFPGATELCDGTDNDCDTATDEEGATGCSWFFDDADGDGHGSGDPFCVCGAPGNGWAVLAGDCDESDSQVHPGALELCDQADNDCDGQADETFDLMTDPANCGKCLYLCQLNNASSTCTAGKCKVTGCLNGYANCNNVDADGCEIHTDQDITNCGGCGKPCVLDHAVPSCAAGKCTVAACQKHYANDDGIAENGCEKNTYGRTAQDPGLCCSDILDVDSKAATGVYWIDPQIDGSAFQVYCEMTYDGGGWTLIEMQASNTALDATYWSAAARNVPALLNFATTPNVAARLGAQDINDIFKRSKGYVQYRYYNNEPGYMLTDVFGSSNPSIVSSGAMDIAKALRGQEGMVGGFCNFYNGQGFTCCNNNGAGMDWRRYNSYKTDNLWCSGVHTYSNNGCNSNTIHGPLGDSYSCNKGGQRNVEGHMWWWYGQGGVPCSGYGQYGCYGSRWIR